MTRLTLRLTDSVYTRAANMASAEKRSLNSMLEMLIELGLTALEPLDGVAGAEPLPGQTQLYVDANDLADAQEEMSDKALAHLHEVKPDPKVKK